MFVRDEHADEAIRGQVTIQDAVQGRSILLRVPGHLTGVTVNMCVIFGWMGFAIAVSRMSPAPQRHVVFFVGALVAMTALGVLTYRVARGYPSARVRMYHFLAGLVIVTLGACAVAMLLRDWVALTFASVGVGGFVIARRLVAGQNYALLSAFFRAKRAHAARVQEQESVRRSAMHGGRTE